MTIEGVDWGYELRPQNVKFGNKLDEVIDAVNETINDVNYLGKFFTATEIEGNSINIGVNGYNNFFALKIDFPEYTPVGTSQPMIKFGTYSHRNIFENQSHTRVYRTIWLICNQHCSAESFYNGKYEINTYNLTAYAQNFLINQTQSNTVLPRNLNLFNNVDNNINRLTSFDIMNASEVVVPAEKLTIYNPVDKLIQMAIRNVQS